MNSEYLGKAIMITCCWMFLFIILAKWNLFIGVYEIHIHVDVFSIIDDLCCNKKIYTVASNLN